MKTDDKLKKVATVQKPVPSTNTTTKTAAKPYVPNVIPPKPKPSSNGNKTGK